MGCLSVLTSQRPFRRHIAYDLEWVPGTLEVRLVGVFDERGYRYYENLESFIECELTSENRGRWFYAHAGGLADFQFVLQALLKLRSGYRVKHQIDGKFSGSSAIIVKVKRGQNCWTFLDSFWLLRDSLKNIGKWIGMEKGEEEAKGETQEEIRAWFRDVPLKRLIEYNETDCEILYEAISQMQNALLDMGGQLQMTQAASAMNLFRREYLKANIPTNYWVNEKIRKAYFASRVEVFNRECVDANYYDINSSFPYAMTMPCPGRFLGSSRKLPSKGIYFADVTIESPDDYLPPVPARIHGKLFFPVGGWRSWLSSVDIELLVRRGGRILKVHEAYHFEEFHDLSNYAKDLYEKRKRSEGFLKVAYKLLLNSLYGKFAESPFKSSMLIDPCPDRINRDTDEMLMPGVWLIERKVPVPHMHVPISAHITAVARRTLFDHISQCQDVHYCDTDGFSTTSTLPTANDLGALKLEKLIRKGYYVAPKLYLQEGTFLDEKGQWSEISESKEANYGVKAKGFSKPSVEEFWRLTEGLEIDRIRMRRVKELLRRAYRGRHGRDKDADGPYSSLMKPEEVEIKKRLKIEDMTPKRPFLPNGDTRPWHIKELSALEAAS